MAKSPPPGMFQEKIKVPEEGYRTAIAIKHEGRMSDVSVTFVLSEQDGTSATYEALCPRCGSGKIVVCVALDPNGSFAAEPACPALCLDCEDRLDAILEPEAAKPIADEPGNRATLAKYLKAMTQRSWDR